MKGSRNGLGMNSESQVRISSARSIPQPRMAGQQVLRFAKCPLPKEEILKDKGPSLPDHAQCLVEQFLPILHVTHLVEDEVADHGIEGAILERQGRGACLLENHVPGYTFQLGIPFAHRPGVFPPGAPSVDPGHLRPRKRLGDGDRQSPTATSYIQHLSRILAAEVIEDQGSDPGLEVPATR